MANKNAEMGNGNGKRVAGQGQTFNYLDDDAKVAQFFNPNSNSSCSCSFGFGFGLGNGRCLQKVNLITQLLSLLLLAFCNYKQLYKLQLIKLQAPSQK